MIPNISRGDGVQELSAYLVSTEAYGRAVHKDPHLVAGTPSIMAEYNGLILDHAASLEVARKLDESRRLLDVKVAGGSVWHCSLSLAKSDGVRTDDEWAKWSQEFLQRMGFIDAEGRLDVPYAVVRHGLSGKHGDGQDHVHIVASLVREDGTRASTWKDWPRAQAACRELEKEHGLFEVAAGFGAREDTLGERKAAKSKGLPETERATLERYVRESQVLAKSEAEFVRHLRSLPVVVVPRFSKDGTRAVGYSLSLEREDRSQSVPYGGSRIANDLGLGVLRKSWAEPSVEDWQDAHKQWVDAKREYPLDAPERAAGPVEATFLIAGAIDEIERERVRMESVPLDDHEEWRRYLAHGAGITASWSRVLEGDAGGPIRNVADTLGRCAQVSRSQYRPKGHRPNPTPTFSQLIDAYRGGERQGALGLMRELSLLAAAARRYVRARQDAVKADAITATAKQDIRQAMADLKKMTEGLGAVMPEKLSGAAAEPQETLKKSEGETLGVPVKEDEAVQLVPSEAAQAAMRVSQQAGRGASQKVEGERAYSERVRSSEQVVRRSYGM